MKVAKEYHVVLVNKKTGKTYLFDLINNRYDSNLYTKVVDVLPINLEKWGGLPILKNGFVA